MAPPGASNATHDFFACEYFVSPNQPTFTVRLCTWGDAPTYDRQKVSDTLRSVLEGIKPAAPLRITVVLVDPGVLARGLWGMFEPVSKVIFISPEASPAPPNYKFYYTLGHEIVHGIMDQQHIAWPEQHCLMGKGPSLKPLRALIRSWNPDADFENLLNLALQCNRGE